MGAMTVTADPVAPAHTVLRLTNAVVASRALHVIAEIGVADAIGDDEEVSVDVVAARCGCHPDALHRVLRLLEAHGAFRSEQRLWSHTSASLLLRSDHPTSMRPYTRMIGQPQSWDAITQLSSSLRDGRPAPVLREAGGAFAYLQRHPEQLRVFNDAMTAKSHADLEAILDAFDFTRFGKAADIAGGHGHLVQAILDRYPTAQGILFELPQVAEAVAPSERLNVSPGDFFVDDLPGADVSLLMHIIHDWDDVDARRILSAVARVNEPGHTVLLFEWILPDAPDDFANVFDVFMLTITGGRERTASQYQRLLDDTGFDLVAIHPTNSPIRIIEARRR